MLSPWRLLRIALRTILSGTLIWLVLALLWAFLPTPIPEHDGDGAQYATSVMRTGKTLTRVYKWVSLGSATLEKVADVVISSSKILHSQHERQGFAIDYTLDVENLTLLIGEHAVPILNEKWADGWDGDITGELAEHLEVSARIGDTDGANLPWFPFADSVLLFWWIHKESMSLELSLQWRALPMDRWRLEIHKAAQEWDEPLLSVEIRGGDPSTIVVTVPEMPLSSSPSSTYPVRLAIIHFIAPTAVFVNFLLGNVFGPIIEFVFTALYYLFLCALCGLINTAIMFSLWRCFGGQSFKDTVEGIRVRLERLNENERLQIWKTKIMQEKLDFIIRNERFMAAVKICRNGWHPRSDGAVVNEVTADVEKGLNVTGEGEDCVADESIASKQ